MQGFFPCRKGNICQISSFRDRRCLSFLVNTELKKTMISMRLLHVLQNMLSTLSNVRVLSSTLDALNVHCMYILLAFVCNIKQSFEEHNLSRVDIMLDMMARIQQVLLFVALDKALLHWRGINMIRVMSRLETRWTFYIQTP